MRTQLRMSAPATARPHAGAAALADRPRIILYTPDDALQRAVSWFAQDLGATLDHVETLPQAPTSGEQPPAALVIVDLDALPRNARPALAHLRATVGAAPTLLVGMGAEVRAADLGAFAGLSRPLQEPRLLRLVRDTLGVQLDWMS